MFVASVAGQLVGRASSGVCGSAEKVGEPFEFGVPISSADLVDRGVHPRVRAEQLRVPVAGGPDDDGAAVGRVAVAGTQPARSSLSRMPVNTRAFVVARAEPSICMSAAMVGLPTRSVPPRDNLVPRGPSG